MTRNSSSELAILVGAPHKDQTAMHNDVAAMYRALQQRGLASDQILCLEGKLDRRLLRGFLATIGQRIAGWTEGTVLLYITGHGFFTGDNAAEARVGIELQPADQYRPEVHIYWDELFAALAIPPGVQMLLLPDH